MQNSITKTLALGYNIGAEWDGVNKSPAIIYTFAPGLSIGEKLYTYVEAFGAIVKNQPQHSLDGGVAYYLNNNLKVDISGGFGISPAAPDWYSSIGCSVRFNTADK